jgi:hypothetical protein
MIPVRVAQEKNTRNAADSTKRHHCVAHRMVTIQLKYHTIDDAASELDRYLLMPDPRSVTVSEEIIIGYDDRRADAFDSYGRRPGQRGFKDERLAERERKTHYAFQGEFARMFGPKRRGISYNFGALDKAEDSSEFHQWHLSLEKKIVRPGTTAKLNNRAKKRKQRHEHRKIMNPR